MNLGIKIIHRLIDEILDEIKSFSSRTITNVDDPIGNSYWSGYDEGYNTAVQQIAEYFTKMKDEFK